MYVHEMNAPKEVRVGSRLVPLLYTISECGGSVAAYCRDQHHFVPCSAGVVVTAQGSLCQVSVVNEGDSSARRVQESALLSKHYNVRSLSPYL